MFNVGPSLIRKEGLYNYVLVPVKKSTALALNFQFHDLDLSIDYPNGTNKSECPVNFDQTTISGTGIIVLAAVPCAIPYGYGTTLPTGEFDARVDLIANMEGSEDFTALDELYKTLKANNFQSYHWIGTSTGPKIGANKTNIAVLTDVMARISPKLVIPCVQLRHNAPDHKKIREAIKVTSKALMDSWAKTHDDNQLLSQHGLNQPPGAKKLSMKATFSECKYALVLTTLSPNPGGTNTGNNYTKRLKRSSQPLKTSHQA